MDYTNLVFGIIALGFGLFMAYKGYTGEIYNSQRLILMKEKLGDKFGQLLYTIAYMMLPIIVGVVLLAEVFLTKS